MNIETQLVQAFTGLLSVALTAGIGIITPKIKKFIETHTTAKTAKVANDVVDGLAKVSEAVVADFNQRIVTDVKAKGGWTPELAVQTKLDAIAAIKSQGSAFIALTKKTESELEPLISTLIEQAIVKAKGTK